MKSSSNTVFISAQPGAQPGSSAATTEPERMATVKGPNRSDSSPGSGGVAH